jgi:hypothetical protein
MFTSPSDTTTCDMNGEANIGEYAQCEPEDMRVMDTNLDKGICAKHAVA